MPSSMLTLSALLAGSPPLHLTVIVMVRLVGSFDTLDWMRNVVPLPAFSLAYRKNLISVGKSPLAMVDTAAPPSGPSTASVDGGKALRGITITVASESATAPHFD